MENKSSSSPENLAEATHGDIVEVSIFTQNLKQKERGARREGEVVNIIKRGIQEIVGTLEHVRNHFFVVPDDKRFNREILITKEELHGATEDDKIVVEIISWGRRYENSKGRVIEILGKAGEMSAEILSVVREFHLPVKFSDEVVMEMNTISSNISQNEIKNRLDLRDLCCFTIDPEDAKDFDDAVSLEKLPDGNYRLGVHIADVSVLCEGRECTR